VQRAEKEQKNEVEIKILADTVRRSMFEHNV